MSTSTTSDPVDSAPSARRSVPGSVWIFLAIGIVILAATTLRMLVPAPSDSVADQASKLLRSYKDEPLEGDLAQLLAEPEKYYVSTIDHPLVGSQAPDWTLNDWRGRQVRLADALAEGPVVLIFYYGFWCDHCVVQLFDMNEERKRFEQLGARIIAVSADPPEETAAKFAQFGPFEFDTLSDPGNRVAQLYDCYEPPAGDAPDQLFHGTFVIGRDGVIRWADIGEQPFRSIKTLLLQLAWMEDKLPTSLGDPPIPR